MTFRGPRIIGVTALAALLSVTGLAALPGNAPAQPIAPDTRVGERGPSHYPASVNTTLGPNQNSKVTSPTLPAEATSIKVVVEGQELTQEEYDNFREWTYFLTTPKTKAAKLLVCIQLHQVHLTKFSEQYPQDAEIDVTEAEAALVYLAGCLQAASIIYNAQNPRMSAPTSARAGTQCPREAAQLAASIAKVDGGYRLTTTGGASKARKGGGLKVRCVPKGKKLIFTVKASKKGKPLRKVLGKRLSFAILSPPDATASVTAKITFAKPR